MTVHDEQVLLRLWAVAPPYRAAFRASLGVLLAAFWRETSRDLAET